jgi:hypothetical protein
MEHPFIHNIESLSDEELADKISTLNQRMSWCLRMNKGDIARQVSMMLESYRSEHQRRMDKIRKDSTDFDNKIKIQ